MLILWDELPSTVPLILGVCSWTLQHMCEDNIAWMINHLSTEPSLTCLQWMLVNFMNKGIACQCLLCIQKIINVPKLGYIVNFLLGAKDILVK